MDEKMYWLGFSSFPGIGPLRFAILRKFFHSIKSAWEASEQSLLAIGLGNKLTSDFVKFRSSFSLERYYAEIQKKQIAVITLDEPEYPSQLKEISDAPFVLYARGDVTVLQDCYLHVGIVGTRQITPYGEEATKKITRGLARRGIVVVSGMAYGVDTVAHETTVKEGGKTIAVLGCGVDIIHPVSNTRLYFDIVKEKGCVVSEFPVGLRVTKGLFPARNRIISGLSLGVVVTQGDRTSGALITARYAAEQGRDVFAVPGPITSTLSEGPTILLKQGAKLVTEAEDILEEFNIKTDPNSVLGASLKQNKFVLRNKHSDQTHPILLKEEKNILDILLGESLHFDELVQKTGISSPKLAEILTVMEVKHMVEKKEGKYWVRTEE